MAERRESIGEGFMNVSNQVATDVLNEMVQEAMHLEMMEEEEDDAIEPNTKAIVSTELLKEE